MQMGHWFRGIALAIFMPLALTGCLFVPGKFVSDLTIRADRSFTFAYKGEVHAVDLESSMGGMMKGFGDALKVEDKAEGQEDAAPAEPEPTPEEKAEAKAERDAKFREVATQLAKEAGYRLVEYRGEGVFYVDYAISGRLSHNFVYPYNQDSAMVFPWVAIELRGNDQLRVKAPGFAKQDSSAMGAGMSESKVDGIFTLTTDAEIVSQNNEAGAETVGGNKVIRWRVTPTTEDPPMAVLKVAGL
jgi:hypothetical protein